MLDTYRGVPKKEGFRKPLPTLNKRSFKKAQAFSRGGNNWVLVMNFSTLI
jgi:hypothetical protein